MSLTERQATEKAIELAKANHRIYYVVDWLLGGIHVATDVCLNTWAEGSAVLVTVGADGAPVVAA